MHDINLSAEAADAVGHLPHDALKALAELVDLLTLQPHADRLYRGAGSNLRTTTVADGELLAVWLVLDDPPRVEILRLMWLGQPGD